MLWISGTTRLMELQSEMTLIRRRAFCAASDQSLNLLSQMSICRKHFSRFRHNFIKQIYEYKYMENADLGKHRFLLKKLNFSIWLHMSRRNGLAKWMIIVVLIITVHFWWSLVHIHCNLSIVLKRSSFKWVQLQPTCFH